MNDEIRTYFLMMLTHLGQMNHPHRDSKLEGVMTMPLKAREEICSGGWQLIENDKGNPDWRRF